MHLLCGGDRLRVWGYFYEVVFRRASAVFVETVGRDRYTVTGERT